MLRQQQQSQGVSKMRCTFNCCNQPPGLHTRVHGTFCKAIDARPFTYPRHLVTVAILAQGTSWAVADTQALLHSGSNPPAPQSILNQNFTSIPKSKTNENVPIPNLGLEHFSTYSTSNFFFMFRGVSQRGRNHVAEHFPLTAIPRRMHRISSDLRS